MLTQITRVLSFIPLAMQYRLAWLVYVLVYRVLRLRRAVVESNLSRSFPEKTEREIRELGQRVFRNYADVLVEMLASRSMSEAELIDRVTFTGDGLLKEDLDNGKPVLLTLAHHCNLEWMLLAACLHFDYPVEVVYRPLANAGMESLATEAYTRFGGRLIDDRSVIKTIMARRAVPRIVTLISDQGPNVKDDVYWTQFLNQETGFFMAPEIIARFTGYPVYFARMSRESRGHYAVDFEKIATPPYKGREQAVVSAYVRAVEAQIRNAPEDWFWMHRRWKRQRSMYAKTQI